jgi:hypothetical protein
MNGCTARTRFAITRAESFISLTVSLTTRQKILLGIVILGIGAVLIDRLLLDSGASGPRSAAASVVTSMPDVVPVTAMVGEAAPTATTDMSPSFDGPFLAERLAMYASENDVLPQHVADIFTPSNTWCNTETVAPGPAGKDGDEQAVSNFIKNYTLGSVLVSDGNGVAVINGKPVLVGQRVKGFELVQITGNAAVFTQNGGEQQVKLVLDANAR